MERLLTLVVLLSVAVCSGMGGKALATSPSSDEPESAAITFPKIDRVNESQSFGRGALESLPRRDPGSGRPWQVDLRGHDVSRLDLRESLDDLLAADFDSATIWPDDNRMPKGFDYHHIMELGKNPGLGVRTLHEQGITGRGVGVAIIDQALPTQHEEYSDRLRLYEEIDLRDREDPSMHGAAVASIAVGKTVGVAPEADLYYIAAWPGYRESDGFVYDYTWYARGIRRFLEINKQLPADRKIRVISISKGWSPKQDAYDDIMAACEEAKAAGMLVVCSSVDDVHGFCFDGLGRSPVSDPDEFSSYEPGSWLAKDFFQGTREWNQLWVPMDTRTTASPCGNDEYVFYRNGGWSWSIPYCAGLYALAVQVDPEITPDRFWELAMKTGRMIEIEHDGKQYTLGPIADPIALIEALQAD